MFDKFVIPFVAILVNTKTNEIMQVNLKAPHGGEFDVAWTEGLAVAEKHGWRRDQVSIRKVLT